MEKVYVLWNYDVEEPLMASTDESLLEEIMCDMFMEDFADDCNWVIHNASDVSVPERLAEMAEDSWECTLDFYCNYLYIEAVPLV